MANALAAGDLARLVRSTYKTADTQSSLTPELLGRMIAWARYVFRGEKDLETGPEAMFQFLLHPKKPMPTSVASIVHVNRRVDGDHVEELTRMLLGAQSSHTIGRLNPDTTAPVFKVDQILAEQTLSSFAAYYPAEVAWLKAEFSEQQPHAV